MSGCAHTLTKNTWASLVPQTVKSPPTKQEAGLDPGPGSSAEQGGQPAPVSLASSDPLSREGSPLQCPGLENPMDGGAWRAAVHGVTESRT